MQIYFKGGSFIKSMIYSSLDDRAILINAIGLQGYFGNTIEELKNNIESKKLSKLIAINPEFYQYVRRSKNGKLEIPTNQPNIEDLLFVSEEEKSFRFFLNAINVEYNKADGYRPYQDFNELISDFKSSYKHSDFIHYRVYGEGERHGLITGYDDHGIFLNAKYCSFRELCNVYEWLDHDQNWHRFGVKEQ